MLTGPAEVQCGVDAFTVNMWKNAVFDLLTVTIQHVLWSTTFAIEHGSQQEELSKLTTLRYTAQLNHKHFCATT